MPIARIQLEDGRIARLEVPEGTSPEQVMQFAQTMGQQKAPKPDEPGRIGLLEGGLRQFAHGASLGFDDELAGAVSAMTGGDYQSARDAYASERDAWRDANPNASLALNVGGGLATGIGAGGAMAGTRLGQAVAAAASRLPQWAQLGASGALYGGIQGAGDAQEGERLGGAAQGAALGAATGAVLPPVMRAAGKGLDATLGNAGRWAVNALRTPDQQGVRILARALSRDELSPTNLEAALAKLGPQATIADAGGANVVRAAKAAVRQPGTAANAGMNALEERAKGAGPRVMSALQQRMGVTSTNTDDAVMQLHERMRQVAAQHGYDRILDTGAADATGQLDELLQTPTVRGALGSAYRMIADEMPFNREARKTLQYFDVAPDGSVSGFKSVPSLRALDYVKRALDAKIGDGTDPITGKLTSEAVRALKLKHGLLSAMDNINPEYAAVRAAYADEKAAESALKMGAGFLSDGADVTARHVKDMTPAERQFFKMGAARAVRDKILGAPDTGMAYQQFMHRPVTREKLAAVFNDDAGFKEFMSQLGNEVRMGKTFAALRGGSDTAENIFGAKELGDDLVDSIPVTSEGWARKLAMALTNPNREVAGQLNARLLSQDPAMKQQTLSELRALGPRMGQPVGLPQLDPRASRLAAALMAQQAAQAGQ